jgi:hypothetical protein
LASETLAVVVVDEVNLRESPGLEAPVQTISPGAPTSGDPVRLSAGELVWILGAERADDTTWYHIVHDNSYQTGWISGGADSDPWLIPFDVGTCPSSLSATLSEGAAVLPLSLEHLACFGAGQLSAVVYWPTPDEGLYDVPCPWPGLESSWLICYEVVNTIGDGSRQLVVYGTEGRQDIRRGEWVSITGHYDDPRAQTCPEDLGRDLTDMAEVAATILNCRTAFVLDEVQPATEP